MQGSLGSLVLVEQAKRLVFKSLTPLFVYDDTSIKKYLGDFVLMLIYLGFGTEPMVSSLLLYE